MHIYIFIYLYTHAEKRIASVTWIKKREGGLNDNTCFHRQRYMQKHTKIYIYTHAEKCIASVPWIKKCQHFGLCHMTSGWHRGEELTCMALVWLLSCYKFKEGRSTIEEVAERRSRTRGFQSKHIFLILFSWHKGMQDSVLGEKKLSPGPSIDS